MKNYWIEKVKYPHGKQGFAECIPFNSYNNKKEALKDFKTLVNDNQNNSTLISLYELNIESDTDILIKQK